MQPHAYLFDAFLVLNEQLNTWDVNVQPGSLRRPFHWSVYTAIVLAAHTHTGKNTFGFPKMCENTVGIKTMHVKVVSYLISISARLLASTKKQYLIQIIFAHSLFVTLNT